MLPGQNLLIKLSLLRFCLTEMQNLKPPDCTETFVHFIFVPIAVLLQESTLSELLEKQCPQTPKTKTSLWLCGTQTEDGATEPLPCYLSAESQHLQCWKGSRLLSPEAKRRLEERRGSEPLRSTQDLVGEGHGHHLHLSSCHECLELENSTILSVKYASAENIPDLPDDNSEGVVSGDETLDEVEHNAGGSFAQSSRFDCNHKPPNVLVYTGGSQERFQAVSQLLSECLNMENNIIYPLLPQQALSDPWLDNTRLLVLAEVEPLTPQLQTRFLTYLSQGGRVLGLASTLCPAGVCLEVRERQRGQISRLSFTREDSTELELNLLASGKVYIRDTQGGGEVELWGELKGDVRHLRDMVIVRVTHEGDVGEAVLCQVKTFTLLKVIVVYKAEGSLATLLGEPVKSNSRQHLHHRFYLYKDNYIVIRNIDTTRDLLLFTVCLLLKLQ